MRLWGETNLEKVIIKAGIECIKIKFFFFKKKGLVTLEDALKALQRILLGSGSDNLSPSLINSNVYAPSSWPGFGRWRRQSYGSH